MALSTKSSARVATKTKTAVGQTARTSKTFIDAFASDKSAVAMMERVESHPLFRNLSERGLVKKSEFAGRIPPDKVRRLSQMRLEDAVEILRRYNVYEHIDLEEATYGGNNAARKRLLSEAEVWGADRAEVERALVSFAEASADNTKYGVANLDEVTEARVAAPRGGGADVEWDIQEVCAQFCAGYEVTETDFYRFFISEDADEISAKEVAEQLSPDCSPGTVEQMRSIIAYWRLESASDEVVTQTTSAPAGDNRAHVANVFQTDGTWVVEMAEKYRNQLYRVTSGVHDKLESEELAQWRQLEGEMRALNERTSRRAQAIRFMCRRQHAFLASGDVADLAPLSQGEIAKQIGVKPDRISRLLFDDDQKNPSKMHRLKSNEYRDPGPALFLRTPGGPVLLRQLLCELAQVVPHIKAKHPDFSDKRVSLYLREQFGVIRTRAAVQAAHTRSKKSPKA